MKNLILILFIAVIFMSCRTYYILDYKCNDVKKEQPTIKPIYYIEHIKNREDMFRVREKINKLIDDHNQRAKK